MMVLHALTQTRTQAAPSAHAHNLSNTHTHTLVVGVPFLSMELLIRLCLLYKDGSRFPNGSFGFPPPRLLRSKSFFLMAYYALRWIHTECYQQALYFLVNILIHS